MSVKSVLLGAAAVAGAGLVYANMETRRFEVKQVSVPILPDGSRPIGILQLADLHYLPSQDTKTAWLESLGELEPDLVVNTGDNVSSRASIPALLDVLKRSGLLDVPGVFVGGSNDYYAPVMKNPAKYLTHHQIPLDLPPMPWHELFNGFEEAGWVNLNNRRAQVQLASGEILDFVGTDDAHHDNDEFPPPVPATLGEHVTARIGVTHAPYLRVLQQFKDHGVALVIAGHTHGGQLRVPGFGAIVTNCDLDRHRAEGLHGWPGAKPTSLNGKDSIWLYVSAGAGTSPYTPFRFDCRPSATLLTLTAKNS